jgi:hypothetical protein
VGRDEKEKRFGGINMESVGLILKKSMEKENLVHPDHRQ